MRKEEFLAEVKERLAGLPAQELEKSLEYYREMIEDRIEDGMEEEEAVAEMGSVEEAAEEILRGTPLPKLVKTKMKLSRTLRSWEIVLLIAGAPIWLPLLVCVVLIFLACYAVLGVMMFVMHAVNLALAAAGAGGIVLAVLQFSAGRHLAGGFYLGSGLFCAGTAVLMFFGAKHLDRILIYTGKRFGLWIKRQFLKRLEERSERVLKEVKSI